jgi:glutathione S-transferase
MLKIYHMPNSRSARILWTAEEIGLPYQIDLRRRSELKKPDFLALNPLGGSPAIEDGDVKMMESMGIVQYLIERYDKGGKLAAPSEPVAHAKYLQWFHFAEGSLAPPMVAYLRNCGMFPALPRNDEALAQAKHVLDIAVGMVDDSLAKTSPYMCGEKLTGADIGIYWCIHIARMVQSIDFDEMPNVAAYMARLDERPQVKTAFAMPKDYVRELPGSAVTPGRPKRRR